MIAILIAATLQMSVGAAPKAPPKKTQMKIQVKPEGAVFYVDGKRKGTGAKAYTIPMTPGRHILKVVNKKDEHEEMVELKQGEEKNWSWEFEDDRPKTPEATPEAAPEGEKKPEAPAGEAPAEKTEAAPEKPAASPAASDDGASKKAGKKKSKKGADGKVDPLDFQ